MRHFLTWLLALGLAVSQTSVFSPVAEKDCCATPTCPEQTTHSCCPGDSLSQHTPQDQGDQGDQGDHHDDCPAHHHCIVCHAPPAADLLDPSHRLANPSHSLLSRLHDDHALPDSPTFQEDKPPLI